MTPAADLQLVSSEICSQQAIKEHTGRTEYTLVYTASYFGLEKTRFFKIRFSFMMVYWLKKTTSPCVQLTFSDVTTLWECWVWGGGGLWEHVDVLKHSVCAAGAGETTQI